MDEMAAYHPPPPPPGIHSSYLSYYQPPSPPPPPPHQHAAPIVIVAQPPTQPVRPPPAVLQQQGLLLPLFRPSPLPGYAQSLPSPQALHDEVRTLFIAGLPEDVQPCEIYNLFREFPGYESSNLRSATNHSQGMVFDQEKGSTLYIDLAKSNSRPKCSRVGNIMNIYSPLLHFLKKDCFPFECSELSKFLSKMPSELWPPENEGPGSDKKFKASPAYSRSTFDSITCVLMADQSVRQTYQNCSLLPNTFFLSSEGELGKADMRSTSRTPQNNPPCPTLFLANRGNTCTEQELTEVFARSHGFLKLKMQNTYGAPVAFIDFQDTSSSTKALSRLQGVILFSSAEGEGMRLDYAKWRMGKRKKPK